MITLDDYSGRKEIWRTTVPSKTTDRIYIIKAFSDGSYSCNCPGRQIHKLCHHVRGAVLMITGEDLLIKTKTKGKPVPTCPVCNAKTVKYKHTLNVPLIKGLEAIARSGRDPVKISELNMSKQQWTNFQKLRYFDLVEQYYDEEDGKRIGGEWIITQRGVDFIKGDIAIYQKVWTYRGVRLDYAGEEVSVHDIIEDYQFREEWAEEAKPQLEVSQ